LFTNKGSGTLMTITVVAPSEACEGSENGVGVSMVTAESLSSFGVQQQEKGVKPDWVFISLSMLGIFSFVLIILGLFILAQKALVKQTQLLQKNQDMRDSAIYYDKIAEQHNA